MIKTFSISNVGKRRKQNQDYLFTSEEPVGKLPNLFIIADGMGGHNAGDYASKVTVETMVADISEGLVEEPVESLRHALYVANGVVYSRSLEDKKLNGMGTTVVAATCIGDVLEVLNVGDSRLYVINKREIRQITRDHSYVEEMVRHGEIDESDARNHPKKNIILRAVGVTDYVEGDIFSVRLNEGDIVLLCTDGLTNEVPDEEIRMIINASRDVVEGAENLVNAANLNGGRDNVSVILIDAAGQK